MGPWFHRISVLIRRDSRTSPVVQWWRLQLPMQGVVGSIFGWGAKMTHALWPKTPNITQIKMAHIKKTKLEEERHQRAFSFSLSSHTQEVTWGRSEKVAACSPRGDSSPEPSHAGTCILDFWPPELLENRFLLFKPLNLCYFVMAVQANTGGFFSIAFRENSALLTPWFWTSGPQDCEKIDSFCFKPWNLWKFVTAAININNFHLGLAGRWTINQAEPIHQRVSPTPLMCLVLGRMNYKQYKK